VESNIGDVVEQVAIKFPIYANTQLFIEKDMKITWQEIKDIFASNFKEDLEDHQVYVNIHKSSLYKVTCRYPTFLCMDVIHWVVSHNDLKTMTLSNTNGTQLATFRTENYHQMYHLLQSMNYMDALFFTPNNNLNSRDIFKHWVKEPSKLTTTPNEVHKKKSLKKAYQLLVIFTCCLYGKESMETFPQSWVVRLD